MYVRVVTFRLAGITPEQYEQHCEEIAEAFTNWPGLTTKVWLADRDTGTFGGVYLFESRADADASRDTPMFAAMSGNPRFAELRVDEFETLTVPTSITSGPVPVTR